jgi:hypothetical protein
MLKAKYLILFLALIFGAKNAAAQSTLPTASVGKNPVIIIPGVTGSSLVNKQTGKQVWFSVRRDKEDDLRLPITSPILANNRDNLEAKDIIREIKLPSIIPDVEVYQSVIDALKGRGYTEADWNNPTGATDVFYIFAYDWRRDNVESSKLLMQKMETVKRSLKRPDLKFDIVAHSMGGLVSRYTAMYGAADLQPAGKLPKPNWAGARHINKILMFGTPNEGTYGSFDAIINGYTLISNRNLPFIDDMRPEDALTIPALFQIMPHPQTARFLDENLEPLKVDFYNPKTWETYGWGAINDPKFLGKLKDAETIKGAEVSKRRKYENADDELLSNTTHAQAKAYFAAVLSRAKRFAIALDAPTTTSPVQMYAFGGNCEPTLDAVVLLRDEKKGTWTTVTKSRDIKTALGREIPSKEVKAAMFALGDGRVTRSSLIAENIPARATTGTVKTVFPLASSFFACGLHTRLFLEKPIQDSFLSALIVEQKTASEKGNQK